MHKRLVAVMLLVATAAAAAPAAATEGSRHGRGDPVVEVGRPLRPALLDERTRALHERLTDQEQDGPLTIVWNVLAGDLDSDGASDIASHHWVITQDPVAYGYSGSLALRAISGGTGEVLWSRSVEFQGGYPYPVVNIRTGDDAAPGLLLYVVDNASPTSPAYRLTMTALGADGETAWERVFQTTSTYFTGGFVTTGAPFSIDPFNALPGAATDVLIGTSSWVAAQATSYARTEISIIDGRDGSMVDRPELEEADHIPFANGAGDLNEDGADDFVFFGNGRVTAYSGAEPAMLWRREAADIVPYLWADPIGDLTGDGTVDLLQRTEQHDTYDVLDGGTGRALWSLEGMFPYALGDVDRDGRVEVGVKSGYLTNDFAGERFAAYRSNGTRLYQETYGVEVKECGGFCLIANSLLHAGDLHGDGVKETFVLRRRFVDGEQIGETRYLVDGRDGKVMHTDRRYVPLLTSVDGRGDDVGSIRVHRGRVTVRTFDARDGAPLWRARLVVQGATELGNWLDPYGAGFAGNEDRCGDVLVTLTGQQGAALVALSGRDGSVLWQRTLHANMYLDDATRSGRTLRC